MLLVDIEYNKEDQLLISSLYYLAPVVALQCKFTSHKLTLLQKFRSTHACM